MTDVSISKSTEAALRAAGWLPKRLVDIDAYRAEWIRRDIEVNDAAEHFCREFGGLEILHPPIVRIGSEEHSDFTRFDPIPAVNGISDRMLAEFRKSRKNHSVR